MPVKVSYQPPAAIVGGASYLAGLGDFALRQQQVNLQQQELAQRDLQQRRAIAASQQSQMFGAQQDAMQRQAQMGMFAAEQQARLGQLGIQRGWELQDQQAAAAAQAEDNRKAFVMERYKSKEWKLNDAARNRLHEINNNMTKVRADAALAPEERAQAVASLESEYWDVLSNPAPTLPGEEEVPWSEKVKGMTSIEPVVSPEGEFMGFNHITRTVRNGEETPAVKFIPYKPPKETDPLADTAGEIKMRESAQKLEQSQRDAVAKARQAEEESIRSLHRSLIGKKKTIGSGDEATERDYTDEEIAAIIERENKLVEKLVAPMPDEAKPPLPGIAGQLQAAGSYNTNPLAQPQQQQQPPQPAATQEGDQMRASLPPPTPEQFARPMPPPSSSEIKNLPHGTVVGPLAGNDGQLYVYQWDAQRQALVRVGHYSGELTEELGPPQRPPADNTPVADPAMIYGQVGFQ